MNPLATQEDILKGIDGQSQLLAAALSASRSGVLITDWQQPDNPIIYCNQAFTEMTGYTLEEIKGRNCRFLQGEDRDQIGRHKLQDAIKNEVPCLTELVNYRKDGTIFYNEVQVSPIRNTKGIVTHYIGIQNDITIRKLKETSLKLELKIANQLQRKKDEFVCIASHELKTPITSLSATLQLLNKLVANGADVDSKMARLVRHAERYAGRMIRSIDELLDSANIIEGGLKLNKTTFSLAEIFNDCCDHLILNGNHRIKFINDHHIDVFADRSKLYHVVTNMIENAVKFAPEAKDIVVAFNFLDRFVRISIADGGPGVDPANAELIFQRYQVGGEDRNKMTGLGLGLFVSSEIIRRHGGEIGLDHDYKEGARFWFTIPINDH